MWGLIITLFLGLYCLMGCYIGYRSWKTLGKFSFKQIYRIIYWCFFAVLILSFPITEIAEDFLPPAGGLWFTIWSGYSMVAVVYIFLLLILLDAVRLMDKRLNFVPASIKEHRRTPLILSFSVLVLVTLTLIYGSWNARSPVVTNYEITINKKVESLQQLQIAMVSDIHYGEIIDLKRLNPMINIIKELQPDIILIAGDIIEGSTGLDETKKFINALSQMPSKYGIFAVPGNHDRWARNDSEEILQAFHEAGIIVLKDQQIKVDDSFYLIGRDDLRGHNRQGRQGLESLMHEVDPTLPIILLDHQPIDLQAAQNHQVDLQLSGHTHVGQVFPANIITGKIYELDWGILKKDNYHLIVSSGYGTWGPPLRIGNNPEVVYVTVNFKNSSAYS